jgi:transposase
MWCRNKGKIKDLGGQAFIPFKKNTSGKSSDNHRSYFKSAFKFFKENKEEYMNRYHKRSNIESCFSMIKRKFGNNVKCRNEISQDNEILGKVLVHNICVLCQELFLNKISLDFNFHAKKYVARN